MISKIVKQISKRAESWNDKALVLEGLVIETNEFGHIVLKSKAKGVNVVATLTLAQAHALQTLLGFELNKQKGVL